MKTGQIPNSVGFGQGGQGTTRDLTIREQLLRNKQFVGINHIYHPIYGIIDVDRAMLDELLNYEEEKLLTFKKSEYGNN
jgi:hypothetical protein